MKPGDAAIHNDRECEIVEVNHIGCRIKYDDDDSAKFIPRTEFDTVVVCGISAAPTVKNKLSKPPKEYASYRIPYISMREEVARRIEKVGMEEYVRVRKSIGEKHGAAILTEPDVIDIKTMAANGVPRKDIVAKYSDKVHESTVGNVLDGRTWGHVKV